MQNFCWILYEILSCFPVWPTSAFLWQNSLANFSQPVWPDDSNLLISYVWNIVPSAGADSGLLGARYEQNQQSDSFIEFA